MRDEQRERAWGKIQIVYHIYSIYATICFCDYMMAVVCLCACDAWRDFGKLIVYCLKCVNKMHFYQNSRINAECISVNFFNQSLWKPLTIGWINWNLKRS